jgi:hypothetical protein
MKLSVCYNIFDELDLLLYSVLQIREHVDFILVNYQNQSYFGEKLESFSNDIRKLNELKNNGMINHINIFNVEYAAKNIPEAKELEKRKRNEGRLICLEKGYDYYLDCDCDEFYKKEEFNRAKKFIIDNKIEFSGCHFVNYQNKPIFRSKKISDGIVPFICKLDQRYELTGAKFLGSCDPTRGYNIVNVPDFKKKLFFPNDLLMHHMTGVRKDLYKKFKYTSLAALDKSRINEAVQTILSINKNNLFINSDFNFIDKEFDIIENYFNINF